MQSFARVRALLEAVRDVLLDGVGKELRVLRHEAEVLVNRAQGEVGQRLAVQCDGAFRWVVEAHEQVNERRLASAAASHESADRAGGDTQVDATQHWLVRAQLVVKVHALERDGATQRPIDGTAFIR